MTSQTRFPSASDTEAVAVPGNVHRRRHHGDQIKFFTIAEVAEFVGMSERTVRRWIERKKLVAHHFGPLVRIAESDLRAFIAKHRDP
jgi:excisionase family DNA binding protein